ENGLHSFYISILLSNHFSQLIWKQGIVNGNDNMIIQSFLAYLSSRGLDNSTFAFPISVQVHSCAILILFILWINIEQLKKQESRKHVRHGPDQVFLLRVSCPFRRS